MGREDQTIRAKGFMFHNGNIYCLRIIN